MRRSVVFPILVLAALGSVSTAARSQNSQVAVTNLEGQARFSADQLDNLAGPVALYPDALLAQVLVAATFPDQVADAAAFVRANGTANIDNQQWDISVKAVAHYPSALNAMGDKIDWTTALGQAYAAQSSEVMQSVQRLRTMAADNGNLNSTQQQQVIQQGTTYEIVPVQPRVIYVPVYDPYVIYSRPIFNLAYSSRYWSFGVGFPIGAWLSYDLDWGQRRVYYNGWEPAYYGYSGNWRLRSQPFIHVTDIYVSPRYRTVYVNRAVTTRVVDYRNVDRYASVHGGSHFESRYDNRGGDFRRDGVSNGREVAGRSGAVRNNDGRVNSNGNDRVENRNGSQPQNGGRFAVPQQRRSEPAQRSADDRPALVVPQRGADTPARNQGETRGQAQYRIEQRQGRAPQTQAQEQTQPQQSAQPQQRVAQPRPAAPREVPQASPRVEQQRTAPAKAPPEQRGRGADARSDRGSSGDRGDDAGSSRHRGR